jgi:hypothetical protein
MHSIEPYYNWRQHYVSSEDPASPFYEMEYSEFEFSNRIYDHFIHPQWDNMGSPTMYLKILFADYDLGVAVIELIGEWNDCLNNDIMFLKREIAEQLMWNGIHKFILIGENVLNFHASDDLYYEEWFDEVDDQGGWIALLNFHEHVLRELADANIDNYFLSGGRLNEMSWRTLTPHQLVGLVEKSVNVRLGQAH